jgi:hypothetical protein
LTTAAGSRQTYWNRVRYLLYLLMVERHFPLHLLYRHFALFGMLKT